jgi:hypothetical protein
MERYLVGGAVRDALMNVTPKDRDWVLVGATQQDIDDMVKEGYQWVGADFPVLIHPKTKEEHALARVERKVGHGYNGFEVDTEGVTLEQDLARRDLTINAMAWDTSPSMVYEDDIIDPYGGRNDIKHKIIRHTTMAFVEDPLRALRVARFAARLSFSVHPTTHDLIKHMGTSGELEHLTDERVWAEVKKGLSGPHPTVFMYQLYNLGIIKHCAVLREVFPWTYEFVAYGVTKYLRMVKEEDRFELGLACMMACGDVEKIKAIPSRTKKVYNNIGYLNEIHDWSNVAADKLVTVITKIGGLREGTMFDDIVTCLQLTKPTQIEIIDILTASRMVMQQVRADQFPDLEGQALGAAMIQERAKRVAELLLQ